MCLPFMDGITVTGPHMEPDKFRQYASQIFPFVTRFQPSVSGEPLMTKGFPEMIRQARQFGVSVEIVTNATLLNDRMQDLLLECASRVTLSFDGADKETFEHIRRSANFDQVVENIRAFATKVRRLPASERPLIGFNVTIMRRNIRQLSAIVRLAHELGLHFVTTAHVFPATDEIREESLAHDQALAEACIEEAACTAKELGIYLRVLPLDDYIVSNAREGNRTSLASASGPVESRLREREIGSCAPERSFLDEGYADHSEVMMRRALAWEGATFPEPQMTSRFPKRERPIWVCYFLWNAAYVQLEGGVRPCCMPGPPEVGTLEAESFQEIWNGPAYRELRQRLVARDPVPVCRGCQHIREIKDPKHIARWLQGGSPPEPEAIAVSPYSALPANGATAVEV